MTRFTTINFIYLLYYHSIYLEIGNSLIQYLLIIYVIIIVIIIKVIIVIILIILIIVIITNWQGIFVKMFSTRTASMIDYCDDDYKRVRSCCLCDY